MCRFSAIRVIGPEFIRPRVSDRKHRAKVKNKTNNSTLKTRITSGSAADGVAVTEPWYQHRGHVLGPHCSRVSSLKI